MGEMLARIYTLSWMSLVAVVEALLMITVGAATLLAIGYVILGLATLVEVVARKVRR